MLREVPTGFNYYFIIITAFALTPCSSSNCDAISMKKTPWRLSISDLGSSCGVWGHQVLKSTNHLNVSWHQRISCEEDITTNLEVGVWPGQTLSQRPPKSQCDRWRVLVKMLLFQYIQEKTHEILKKGISLVSNPIPSVYKTVAISSGPQLHSWKAYRITASDSHRQVDGGSR